jgi:hypothetical protein
VIGSTRLLHVKNARGRALTKETSDAQLRIVSKAMDKLLMWALNTLARMKRSSNTLLIWLRSCRFEDPNRRPFHLPQEPTTVKRYANLWKQFLFYVLRTSSLDESTRDREYGIHFTENQLTIIQQLREMLDAYDEDRDQDESDEDDDSDDNYDDEEDDDDFHQYNPDEDDEDDDDDDNDDDEDDDPVDDYSPSLTAVAEKLMQLSMAFITQHFPSGDDLHSPLVHFADIMGISNRTGRFNEPYNYTSYVAGLMWMCRLLVMEYALPSREYVTLGWPCYEAYENSGERFKQLHRSHLVLGSFRPMNRLISVLAFGKETVKAVGRPGLLMWDPDNQGLAIKSIHLRLDAFTQFVQDGIQSTEAILREQLFFGMDLPVIDLSKITDVYGEIKPLYSFLEGSADKLPDGGEFMLRFMKSADPSKHLIDAQGRWNKVRMAEYLKAKKVFLRKLMKGIMIPF